MRKKPTLTQPEKPGLKTTRIKLDHRTIVTVSSQKAIDFWKERYPKAVVL